MIRGDMMFKFVWLIVGTLLLSAYCAAGEMKVATEVDPVSRYVRVKYDVPIGAPAVVIARCTYQVKGQSDWKTAAVKRYRSLTGETCVQDKGILEKELSTGEVTENLAAGRTRTLVWQNHLQLSAEQKHELTVRVELLDEQRTPLAQGQTALSLDLSDVVLFDREMIFQRVPLEQPGGKPGWVWRSDLPGSPAQGMLDCNETIGKFPPLAIRPQISGRYAIFVSVPATPNSEIELRLASDAFYQRFPGDDTEEFFWKIAAMDGEHLVAQQSWRMIERPEYIGDESRSRLRQVRFVPIDDALYAKLTALDQMKRDKLVHAYFEIYSWAYLDYVDRNSLMLEPIAAYADAKVDAVDAQLGRFGAKPNYPSLIEPPLITDTIGDPEPGGTPPSNPNVALLGLYTDCWRAAQWAGKALDIPVIANFGAGNAYPTMAPEGEFAKKNPQWMSDDKQWVQYKFKEVRDYNLAMYREILDRGARWLSIDFCRYPYVIDKPETATLFLKELRALADEYVKEGEPRVKISARFPVPGIKGGDRFDPRPWVEQKLVDYISPSDVVANASYADVSKYIEMTRGTDVKCLPCIDLLTSGPTWTGDVLRRADHLYQLGADGVYLYQADARIGGTMQFRAAIGHRDFLARLGSSAAVAEMRRQHDAEQQNYGTEIYIYYPEPYSTIRPKVWIEGGNVQEIRYFMDGKRIGGRTQAPYEIGLEGYQNNLPVVGKAVFEVRARIDGKWLGKTLETQIFPDYNN